MNWKNINDIDESEEIGYELKEKEKYKESIKVYKKILKINPNNINALHDIAHSLAHLGKYNQAIKIYTKILMIDPNDELAKKGIAYQEIFKRFKLQ